MENGRDQAGMSMGAPGLEHPQKKQWVLSTHSQCCEAVVLISCSEAGGGIWAEGSKQQGAWRRVWSQGEERQMEGRELRERGAGGAGPQEGKGDGASPGKNKSQHLWLRG